MAHDNSHLRTIVNQDGAAVLDTRLGSIATLNSTGAFVWQALEQGDSLETIAVNLSRQTGESLDTVKRDVTEFVEALRAKQLLATEEVEGLQ